MDHGRRDVFPLRREGDGGDRVVLGQCAVGALRGHGGFAAAPAGELPVLAGGGDDGGQDGVRPAQTGLGLHRGAAVCIKIDTIAALGGPDRVERQRGVIFIDAVEGIDHFAAVHGSPAGLYIADAGEKCAVQREECVLYFQVCDRFAGAVRAWQIGHIVGNGGQLQLFCRIVARNVVLPVGGEICGEIAVVRAAEEDGSVHGRNFFGHNADRCAVRHSADGQSPAGGQIHVVCLAGNGIALHDGRAAEVQLAIVAGIDVDAAAVVAGGVVLNDASGEVADGTRAVDVHAAAAAGGRIAGDGAAAHGQHRGLAVQVDRAAVFGGVTADLAAVEVDIRRLGENAAALVAAGASAQRAGADAVADVRHREVRALRAAQGNGWLGLIRAGEGIAVQANGQMLSRLQRQVGRNVAR